MASFTETVRASSDVSHSCASPSRSWLSSSDLDSTELPPSVVSLPLALLLSPSALPPPPLLVVFFQRRTSPRSAPCSCTPAPAPNTSWVGGSRACHFDLPPRPPPRPLPRPPPPPLARLEPLGIRFDSSSVEPVCPTKMLEAGCNA